jgi:hypothetical protein
MDTESKQYKTPSYTRKAINAYHKRCTEKANEDEDYKNSLKERQKKHSTTYYEKHKERIKQKERETYAKKTEKLLAQRAAEKEEAEKLKQEAEKENEINLNLSIKINKDQPNRIISMRLIP